MSPSLAGRRKMTCPVRDAPGGGWSAGKTPATEASFTAARTFPCASTRHVRVRIAERDCRSGPTALTAAATAAGPSRPVPSAAAGWSPEWAGTAASSAARTGRIATTRETRGSRETGTGRRRTMRNSDSARRRRQRDLFPFARTSLLQAALIALCT